MISFYIYGYKSVEKRMQDGYSFANYKLFLDVTSCSPLHGRERSVTCNLKFGRICKKEAGQRIFTRSGVWHTYLGKISKEMSKIENCAMEISRSLVVRQKPFFH